MKKRCQFRKQTQWKNISEYFRSHLSSKPETGFVQNSTPWHSDWCNSLHPRTAQHLLRILGSLDIGRDGDGQRNSQGRGGRMDFALSATENIVAIGQDAFRGSIYRVASWRRQALQYLLSFFARITILGLVYIRVRTPLILRLMQQAVR